MPALMELIGDDQACVVHSLGHVSRFPSGRSTKIQDIGVRPWGKDQGGKARGECLRVKVSEEILDPFSYGQGALSLAKALLPQPRFSDADSFALKHADKGIRGDLEAVDSEVIGKRLLVALQKGFKIRNDVLVF